MRVSGRLDEVIGGDVHFLIVAYSLVLIVTCNSVLAVMSGVLKSRRGEP